MLLLCALIVGSNAWAEKVTAIANIVAGTRYYIGATTSSTDYYLQLPATSDNLGTAVTSSASATVFIFEATETANVYKIKIADTSNYLATMSISNGKMTFGATAAEYTVSNQSGKIRLSNNSRSIQKNNSNTRFGSYANTQTDVWLTEAPSASAVAKPTISGLESFLTSTQVSISCGTTGAAIQYSTDGGTSWNNYSTAFTLTETTTVQAKATKSGLTDSEVASKTFTKTTEKTVAEALTAIDALDENGTIGGYYVKGIVSTAGSLSSGKITYYISDDGTTTSQLKVYSGKGLNDAYFTSADDIQLGDKVTVYGTVKKYVSGTTTTPEFDTGNYLYSIVKKPTFSPVAGAVAAGTAVTISSTLDGATIYYTTDGTTPTTVSSVYSAPIVVNAAMTIKAIAVKDGYPESSVAEAAYTIAEPCATPTFSVAAGAYSTAQSITISCATDGATIYYTTNGTVPTSSSTEYTSAISLNSDKTIKAIAIKDGYANSAIAEATYTFYAALPFTFDAGSSAIATTVGLCQDGLGGDYGSSPKLKFDTTGDYLILNFAQTPGKLSYTLKGNGIGGNYTFSVLESANGTDYSVLEEYNSTNTIGSSAFTETLTPASTTRYIKWIYTTKDEGNVALGKISLALPEPASPTTSGDETYLTTSDNMAGWRAFYDASNSYSVDGNTKVYVADADPVGTTITLKAIEGIPANVPVILHTSSSADSHKMTLTKETATPFTYTGTNNLTWTTSAVSEKYRLGYGASGVGFYPYSGTPASGAVILDVSSRVGAHELTIDFGENEVTAINEAKSQQPTANGQYYDLQGRKVANPTKGLYIVNGRKVIVK